MNDPIVDEVRKARAAIMARAGNDLEKLFDMVKASEKAGGRQTVRRHPKLLNRDAAPPKAA